MSDEDNRKVVRRYFYEVFNQANLATLDEISGPDFIFTLPTHPEPYRGVEGYRNLVNMLVGSFPDIHFAIEDMLAEGDRVLTRWTARGTHTGAPFPTVIGDIPAAGNSFLISGMTWHRVVDGKLAEVTANEDSLGLVQQLGRAVLPTGAAPTPTGPTSPEVSKQLVGRYFDEVMNRRSLETIDEIMAPDFVFRIPTLPDPVRGRDGMKQFVSGLHASFPDIKFTLEYQVIDGNKVGVRYSMTGTHKGEFLSVPPSNNAVTDRGNDLFHLRGDQIAAIWVIEDSLGLVEQLQARGG